MWRSLVIAASLLAHPMSPSPVQCESSAAEQQRWSAWCEDLDGNPVRNDDGTWSCLDEEGNVYVDDDVPEECYSDGINCPE